MISCRRMQPPQPSAGNSEASPAALRINCTVTAYQIKKMKEKRKKIYIVLALCFVFFLVGSLKTKVPDFCYKNNANILGAVSLTIHSILLDWFSSFSVQKTSGKYLPSKSMTLFLHCWTSLVSVKFLDVFALRQQLWFRLQHGGINSLNILPPSIHYQSLGWPVVPGDPSCCSLWPLALNKHGSIATPSMWEPV